MEYTHTYIYKYMYLYSIKNQMEYTNINTKGVSRYNKPIFNTKCTLPENIFKLLNQ